MVWNNLIGWKKATSFMKIWGGIAIILVKIGSKILNFCKLGYRQEKFFKKATIISSFSDIFQNKNVFYGINTLAGNLS